MKNCKTCRLEEIKNEVSKKYYFKNWDDSMIEIATSIGSRSVQTLKVERLMNEVQKIYTLECIKASLEKAYFNHEIFTRNGHDEEIFELNKESIINESNIVLL